VRAVGKGPARADDQVWAKAQPHKPLTTPLICFTEESICMHASEEPKKAQQEETKHDEVRVEGLETLDYFDNLARRERFTEQADAITFDGEVPLFSFQLVAKPIHLQHLFFQFKLYFKVAGLRKWGFRSGFLGLFQRVVFSIMFFKVAGL
ncbi:unnamed protein product, partial [Prunus brigantina]